MWNGMSSRYNQVLCGRAEPRFGAWMLLAGDGVPDVKVQRPQRSEDERP